MRCLEKDRANRYGNIAELAMALVEFGPRRCRASAERISRTVQAAGLSKSALLLPPSSGIVSDPPQHPGTMASWGQTGPRPSGGRRGILGLFAVVALAASAGGVAWVMRSSPVQSVSTVVASPPVQPVATATATEAPTHAETASSAASASAVSASATAPVAPAAPDKLRSALGPKVATPRFPTSAPPAAQKTPAAPPPTKPGDLGGRY